MPRNAPIINNHGSVPSFASAQRPISSPETTEATNVQPRCVYWATDRIVSGQDDFLGGGVGFEIMGTASVPD